LAPIDDTSPLSDGFAQKFFLGNELLAYIYFFSFFDFSAFSLSLSILLKIAWSISMYAAAVDVCVMKTLNAWRKVLVFIPQKQSPLCPTNQKKAQWGTQEPFVYCGKQ